MKEIRPHLEGIATQPAYDRDVAGHQVKEIRPHLEGIATYSPRYQEACYTAKEIRPHLEGIATVHQLLLLS